MKWILKCYIILLVGYFLRSFFSIFPIRKKNVVFLSFSGEKASCNPYYIYKYLLKEKGFELYWVLNNKENIYKIPHNRIINPKGYSFFKMMFTAGFVITNDRLKSYLIFRKGQKLINTWHGGGAFKRTFGYPNGLQKWYNLKTTSLDSKRTTLFISSSQVWTNVIARKSFLYKGEILSSGFPRNDVFFQDNTTLKSILKKRFHIPPESGVILYAPTYRGKALSATLGAVENTPLDIKQLKERWFQREGKECVVLFRGHHSLTKGLSMDDTIDVTTYPDMQELLIIADVLISDYSSCMWDYALTKRPCFIYAPDFEDYLQNRGFESDYKEWPFFICKDNETLQHKLMTYDQKHYEEMVDKYLYSYGSYERGTASQQVVTWMKQNMR